MTVKVSFSIILTSFSVLFGIIRTGFAAVTAAVVAFDPQPCSPQERSAVAALVQPVNNKIIQQ